MEARPRGRANNSDNGASMPEEAGSMTKQDTVVDLLMRQHQEISRLLTKVEKSTGKPRAEAFDRLRHLLAVHETAEEEIVHPYARRTISNGARVTESIVKEENQAKHTLQELER